MAAAVGNDDALDFGFAFSAGLVGALIDFQVTFEVAHLVVGIAEIAESRSTPSSCAFEYALDLTA